jgi:3-dehydroquinate synthase
MVIPGRVSETFRSRVHCGSKALDELEKFLQSFPVRRSRLFIIADTNTAGHCLPYLLNRCPSVEKGMLIQLDPGESSKDISNAEKIWALMLEAGADRNSLVINLGGGMVSDLGGFAASCFKRGVPYMNVPTSLMGMADAAIGGKTAVNMGNLKNQVGTFCLPLGVFIDTAFLKTLPPAEFRSGLAEVIKSALVGNSVTWKLLLKLHENGRLNYKELSAKPVTELLPEDLVFKTAAFKSRIVSQDFREKKLRKMLNFGHSLGHALESLAISTAGTGGVPVTNGVPVTDGAPVTLLHGEAVALGMIAAAGLSSLKCSLLSSDRQAITGLLSGLFPDRLSMISDMAASDPELEARLWGLLQHDKKNSGGVVKFTLLKAPGKPVLNVPVSREEFGQAFGELISARKK